MSWQEFLPWVTSANTLWAVWLNGRNVRLSWKVSLANQALWLVFIVAFGAWGLLPLTLSLAAVFARHRMVLRALPGRGARHRRPHRSRMYRAIRQAQSPTAL